MQIFKDSKLFYRFEKNYWKYFYEIPRPLDHCGTVRPLLFNLHYHPYRQTSRFSQTVLNPA